MNDDAPYAPSHESHEDFAEPPQTRLKGRQLTGEQHLIAVVTGFPAGFTVAASFAGFGLGWTAGPTLAAAAAGGILGIVAFVFGYGRVNQARRRNSPSAQR